MLIEIRQGDITKQPDIDAIVNAANTDLLLGSGVAGAIREAGGPEIEREAVAQAPIRLGEAVRTTAGNLPNKCVIHAAAMGYRPEDKEVPKRFGSLSSEDIIRSATIKSLLRAEEVGYTSIAFPALATGVGGFPVDECARVMGKAVSDYEKVCPESTIKRVVFILHTNVDYNGFKLELGK